jgi:hypothetical protein
MSFNRNPVPMNIHHLPQPSPTVATLPVDPYAASPTDDTPTSPVETAGVTAQYGTLNAANYSDKVFVVFGEATKIHKDSLKALGGKFNGKLKPRPDTGFPGGPAWMFMFERQSPVMEFVNKVNNGTVPTQRTVPTQGPQAALPNVAVPVKNEKFQTVRWKVFIPKEGMSVTIKANGSQLNGTVIQTETHRDVVDTCYILVGETTSKLVICNGGWQVLGYMVDHTVFFKDQMAE